MRGRSTQPTILGHFACILKTKARYTRMCACVTPAKPYIIPSSSEGSRDPSVASCAGVDVRRPSFHLAFCLRLHSASGFETPPVPVEPQPAPVEPQALALLKQPWGPQRDPLRRPGVYRKGYPPILLKAASRLETKFSAHQADTLISQGVESQESRQGTAHPQGRVPGGRGARVQRIPEPSGRCPARV